MHILLHTFRSLSSYSSGSVLPLCIALFCRRRRSFVGDLSLSDVKKPGLDAGDSGQDDQRQTFALLGPQRMSRQALDALMMLVGSLGSLSCILFSPYCTYCCLLYLVCSITVSPGRRRLLTRALSFRLRLSLLCPGCTYSVHIHQTIACKLVGGSDERASAAGNPIATTFGKPTTVDHGPRSSLGADCASTRRDQPVPRHALLGCGQSGGTDPYKSPMKIQGEPLHEPPVAGNRSHEELETSEVWRDASLGSIDSIDRPNCPLRGRRLRWTVPLLKAH
ncbi:hypothetical protein K402DRAFT_210295 [Aulographum hederae CBS 113979]|uniref:Uncharacterized protein n=1 Tax=Aulographum hederae CBS 113979 TaxID=1176131 RepID=A0A6G1GN68_9PEZI|nr:hypothetical protein K402DRAFT_210295 [Aulographum hederae CBS 113979]